MAESTMDKSLASAPARDRQPLSSRLGVVVLLYWLATALAVLLITLPSLKGAVISENDDVMRLVEVRDFLAGQGWFDLMQYRMGLGGGTLMHWSRLIDLPISLLIRFFALFVSPGQAEIAAATAWPILLIPMMLWPLGLAARRIGGNAVMHIALGLGALFAFGCAHFAPGAIDHHNVQLALAMWIAAMLADPRRRASGFAIAGFACALALAIGAETTPYVAVACACVALRWVWQGEAFASPARAFGLSLALSVSGFFFLTVPPRAYAVVTCDNLSLGFYALSALGGAALLLLASLPAISSRPVRLALGIVTGGLLLVAARVIAPECLGNPLASLDPMLVELWLNGITEARSILAEATYEPDAVGGFYAVGLFAMAVCLCRAIRGEKTEFHIILLALIGVSWCVSLVQIRGAFFANMLGILPLAQLIADLRREATAAPRHKGLAFGYVATVLASVPVVWAVAGIAVVEGPAIAADVGRISKLGANGIEAGECGGPADMAALNGLETGVVAAPSNSGAEILRSTRHRILTAPYHRNQQGMLTELHIGLAQPAEAKAFLHGAGVTVIAFCKSDPQTATLIRLKPDGLYAGLARGAVPDYLKPVAVGDGAGFKFYAVQPDRN